MYEKTAWNVLRRLGHNQKTCTTKTAGFTKPNDQLKQEYMEFITKMKKENRFYLHPSVVHSIDVNYSKKPKTGVTTFSPQQRGQQKADSEMLLYTNAIVTMLSDDGINYTPYMLFTYDPKMAKGQKDAARGKRVRSEFEEASKKYDITEDCIIYVKSKETYFAEFPEVNEQFLTHYDIPKKWPYFTWWI